MPLAAGTRLGPYEIVAPAGAGGMGEVYRARDTRLNRDVAKLTAVEYATEGSTFVVGKSRLLFGGRSLSNISGVDVSRIDKRWLMAVPIGEPNSSPLILTTNWTATLKK